MKKQHDKLAEVLKLNPNTVILDGYNDCIVGLCNTFDGVRVLYSEYKILDRLGKQGMTAKDSMIYYENEILGKYHGTHSPVFLMDLDQY